VKRRSPLVTLLAASLLAAACSGGGDADPTDSTTGDTEATVTSTEADQGLQCPEPVTVGVVTDLSGGLSIYGAPLERGVSIGLAYASGSPVQTGATQSYQVEGCEIRVVFGDDRSDPAVAETIAGQMIDEGASVLIGSVGPGTTAALAEVAEARSVILLAATDTPLGLTESGFRGNSFLVALSSAQHAYATCGYFAAALGADTFAQIALDYPAGQRAALSYRSACETAGGEFVAADQLVAAGTSAYTDSVAALAAAEPDALLLTWTGGGLGSLISAVAEALPEDTAFGVTFPPDAVMPLYFDDAIGWTSPVTYHYTAPNTPANDFLIESVAADGTKPDQYDALGMNAALLAVAALHDSGGAVDGDTLRAAVEGAEYDGPKGTMAVRASDHLLMQDTYVVTLISTDDPDREYYETVATVRPEPLCSLEGIAAPRCDQ